MRLHNTQFFMDDGKVPVVECHHHKSEYVDTHTLQIGPVLIYGTLDDLRSLASRISGAVNDLKAAE